MQFRQSRSGRQTALLLLVGALVLWVFALWMFGSTLELSLHHLVSSVNELLARKLSFARAVPAFLMLVLIIASPLLIWNILVEWAASYEISDAGLHFRSLGVSLLVPWHEISTVRIDTVGNEPSAEALVAGDPLSQLDSRLLRALYRSALGRCRLPIYSGIQDRETLIAEIERRTGMHAAAQ